MACRALSARGPRAAAKARPATAAGRSPSAPRGAQTRGRARAAPRAGTHGRNTHGGAARRGRMAAAAGGWEQYSSSGPPIGLMVHARAGRAGSAKRAAPGLRNAADPAPHGAPGGSGAPRRAGRWEGGRAAGEEYKRGPRGPRRARRARAALRAPRRAGPRDVRGRAPVALRARSRRRGAWRKHGRRPSWYKAARLVWQTRAKRARRPNRNEGARLAGPPAAALGSRR